MRVRLFVGFFESLGADVRINLGCCETFVSQQFLHTPQIGPTIQQMCSKTVSQRMGTGHGIQSRLFDIFFKHSANTSCRQTLAESIEKHRFLVGGRAVG